jgi:hypothetical protein
LTLAFHVLWTLCALGTVVLAALAARRLSHVALAAVSCAVALALPAAAEPDAAIVGTAVASVASIVLWRPRFRVVVAAAAGVLAATWTRMVQLQGAPEPVAVAVVAIVAVATVWLTRSHPAFAPVVLVEDGLLLLIALGLVTAGLPVVQDGWRSAVTLTAASGATQGTYVPVWLAAAIGSSLALGALHTVWSRR